MSHWHNQGCQAGFVRVMYTTSQLKVAVLPDAAPTAAAGNLKGAGTHPIARLRLGPRCLLVNSEFV